MNKRQRARIKWWSMALAWTGLIYSTLYVVRPLCEFLKEKTPFDSMINVILVGLILSITLWLVRCRKIKSIKTLFGLAVVLMLYFIGWSMIKYPEEKLHFIEYGVLAYFFWKALRIDVNRFWSYSGAFFLSGTLGWLDEIIQHYLPNRYYQITDVQLNFYSAFLALLMIFIFQENSENGCEFLEN